MTKQLKADLALLSITFVWGASFALMKQAIGFIPPFTFLTYRYFAATLILCALFFKSVRNINRSILKYGLIIGLTMFAGCALQIVGLQFTSASKSGFITGLNVVLVPLFLALKYKKSPPPITVISILIAIAGLGLLSVDSSFTLNIGDFLTFLCAIAFALQVICISKYSPGLDPVGLTIAAMLTVASFSLLPAILYERMDSSFNLQSAFSLAFTAVFCSALAYTVQMTVQKNTSATHAALIFMGEPVFSMVFAFIFLGETLTLRGAAGCVLVFAGMLMSEFRLSRQKEI